MAPGEFIQALRLAGEGFHRGTIQRGSLHPLARFWSAFVHANISPCSHVSDLTEGRATILYTILTGRVMDVGQFIANEIHRCANAAGKAALGHPSLITHLAAWQGWIFLYPRWRKQRRTWNFHIFRGTAQLLLDPGGAISHRQSQSQSPRQHPSLTCGCRLWRPSSTTFSSWNPRCKPYTGWGWPMLTCLGASP